MEQGTLGKRIAYHRKRLGMTQEQLAQRVGVSAQAVSKWENNLSCPDITILPELASIFGISVDELVREGERPQPPEPPQPQVVYVKEKRSLTGTQTAGVCLELIGLALDLLGLVGESNLLVFLGTALIVLGLPLLLAARHPLLIFGWLAVALSLVIFNPYTMAYMPWGLLGGIQLLVMCILSPEEWYVSTQLGILISITRGVLILWLIYGSFHAWNKGRKPT